MASAIDVFCDPVAFTVEECRAVLARAVELGFPVKLHAEQMAHFGGAKLAAELGARSADHLESATRGGLERARRGGRGGRAAARRRR